MYVNPFSICSFSYLAFPFLFEGFVVLLAREHSKSRKTLNSLLPVMLRSFCGPLPFPRLN